MEHGYYQINIAGQAVQINVLINVIN